MPKTLTSKNYLRSQYRMIQYVSIIYLFMVMPQDLSPMFISPSRSRKDAYVTVVIIYVVDVAAGFTRANNKQLM